MRTRETIFPNEEQHRNNRCNARTDTHIDRHAQLERRGRRRPKRRRRSQLVRTSDRQRVPRHLDSCGTEQGRRESKGIECETARQRDDSRVELDRDTTRVAKMQDDVHERHHRKSDTENARLRVRWPTHARTHAPGRSARSSGDGARSRVGSRGQTTNLADSDRRGRPAGRGTTRGRHDEALPDEGRAAGHGTERRARRRPERRKRPQAGGGAARTTPARVEAGGTGGRGEGRSEGGGRDRAEYR